MTSPDSIPADHEAQATLYAHALRDNVTDGSGVLMVDEAYLLTMFSKPRERVQRTATVGYMPEVSARAEQVHRRRVGARLMDGLVR